MASIPPALLDAGAQLRDQAAQALGEACSVLLAAPGGDLVQCYPDGAVVLIPSRGRAEVLRPARGSTDVRTAPRGAR